MSYPKKEKPCGQNQLSDHLFDTDWPDGCCICGWTWDEIKGKTQELASYEKCDFCGKESDEYVPIKRTKDGKSFPVRFCHDCKYQVMKRMLANNRRTES